MKAHSIVMKSGLGFIVVIIALAAGAAWGDAHSVGAPMGATYSAFQKPAMVADFGAIVLAILGSKELIGALIAGTVFVYNRINKSNVSAYRWQRIGDTAQEIVQELVKSGVKNWAELLTKAMKLLTIHTDADPAIKSMTEKETESVKALVASYALRELGHVEKPMVDTATIQFPSNR